MSTLVSSDTPANIASLAVHCASVPGLQHCMATLGVLYDTVGRVSYHKRRCREILDKAVRVVEEISEDWHLSEEADQKKLQVAIDKTVITITEMEADLIKWENQRIWTNWLHRHEINDKINAYESRLKACIDFIQLAAPLSMRGKIKKLQKAVERHHKDATQRKSAQRELRELRTNFDAQSLALTPSELASECEKTTLKAVVSGSTYDVFKGIAWGHMPVALKYYRALSQGVVKDIYFKDWERQIEIWRKLNHPNVLKLFGWCKIDGDIYLVSPWLENGNVTRYLGNVADEISSIDRIRLIVEILRGLRYLHSQNTLHGALCPSGILIEDHGHVVLSDLGLPKLAIPNIPDSVTSPSRKFVYEAPEIGVLQPLSKESDVYSWSMVALEIVSGRAPYYKHRAFGPLMIAIFVKHELPNRVDHACRIFEEHPKMWQLLASCWSREKSERPSAEDLLERLDEIVRDARPCSTASRRTTVAPAANL